MLTRDVHLARKRALGRERGARFRARLREHRLNPTRYDGSVAYDGVVLGQLVLRKYISDYDTADKNKVNAALTRLVFDTAYHPAPRRCPHCGHQL